MGLHGRDDRFRARARLCETVTGRRVISGHRSSTIQCAVERKERDQCPIQEPRDMITAMINIHRE